MVFSGKVDEPQCASTYCSGHGTCEFSDSAADGLNCVCNDKYTGVDCAIRSDGKILALLFLIHILHFCSYFKLSVHFF